MHERGACVFVWLCVFVETLLRSSHTHKGTHGALCECVHERGACVFVWVCVFVETLLQCLHTHEGTLVHFVSVCTSVVRAYLWVYVCLLSVIVICIFMRVCVTRME